MLPPVHQGADVVTHERSNFSSADAEMSPRFVLAGEDGVDQSAAAVGGSDRRQQREGHPQLLHGGPGEAPRGKYHPRHRKLEGKSAVFLFF